MLTVWTVCVGDKYSDDDVYIMRAMVQGNLGEHRFRCLSDRQIPGVDCLIPDEVWPGWWSKLLLFKYATGPNLYLDLDNVITGDLGALVSDRLSMPKNWAQSGHGGCQSSVMAWSESYDFYKSFDPSKLDSPKNGNCGAYGGLWGDQEFITQQLGEPGGYVHAMKGVYSYKYHCRQALPSDAIVVCFHGRPKPCEVNDPWVATRRYM